MKIVTLSLAIIATILLALYLTSLFAIEPYKEELNILEEQKKAIEYQEKPCLTAYCKG